MPEKGFPLANMLLTGVIGAAIGVAGTMVSYQSNLIGNKHFRLQLFQEVKDLNNNADLYETLTLLEALRTFVGNEPALDQAIQRTEEAIAIEEELKRLQAELEEKERLAEQARKEAEAKAAAQEKARAEAAAEAARLAQEAKEQAAQEAEAARAAELAARREALRGLRPEDTEWFWTSRGLRVP